MAVNVNSIETNKTQKKTTTITSTKQGEIQSFLGDVKSEFKKISWTEKDELKTYTKIVVGATLISGFGVFCIDLAIRAGLDGLEAFVRLIFG